MQHLGQHFLKNTAAIENIVAALNVAKGETIIEIGPGRGALTLPLLQTQSQTPFLYIGVEKDPELATELTHTLGVNAQASIRQGDILRDLPLITKDLSAYALLGNIPYYITGHLLRVISELPHKPSRCVLMVQREVAKRLCAGPGEMNLLAAATQFWAKPELLFKLPPSDFDPPPQVHSAVIRLATHSQVPTSTEMETYYQALHVIFKQPRKTLVNNLRAGSSADVHEITALLQTLDIQPAARPQDLTIAACAKIGQWLVQHA